MAIRTQSLIRRDINRFSDLLDSKASQSAALASIVESVTTKTACVNETWRSYQSALILGDKERSERDSAIGQLTGWVQSWRPVLFMLIPGAQSNIRAIPSTGATPDDMVRVAEDMVSLMEKHVSATPFKDAALNELGEKLVIAKKETADATKALPLEVSTREAFSIACSEANEVLVQGLNIVRSVFGPKSSEYKQFIAKSKSKSETDESDEVLEMDEVEA